MGIFAPSGWKTGSLFDQLGNVVQFDEIVVDKSSFQPEAILNELTNGSSQSGSIIPLSIGSTLHDGDAQLRTWAEARTPVNLVVWAEGKHLQWYAWLPMQSFLEDATPDRRTGDSAWQVNLEAIDELPAVFANINLLQGFVENGLVIRGFADADADNLADGYTEIGALLNKAFAAGVQSFDANAANEGIERILRFPLEGPTATLSAEYTVTHSESTALVLEAQDFSGTPLATFTEPVLAPGRVSVSGQLPASTYQIRVFWGTGAGITLSETISFKEPALRLDGKTTYVAA